VGGARVVRGVCARGCVRDADASRVQPTADDAHNAADVEVRGCGAGVRGAGTRMRMALL
jgi:hypothetical protein